MKVSDVEDLFRPLADAMLDKGLTLPQVRKALHAVVVMRALERNGRKQAVVAKMLGVTTSFVSNVVNGKQKAGPAKEYATNWVKKHGGTPQQVLGGMEL